MDIPEKYWYLIASKKQQIADEINAAVGNFGPHKCRASDIPDDDPDVMQTIDAIRHQVAMGKR